MAAVLLEMFARHRATRSLDPGILFLLVVATASAVVSVLIRLILSAADGAAADAGGGSMVWPVLLALLGGLSLYLKFECYKRRLGALPDFSQGIPAVISGAWTLSYRAALGAAVATFFIGIIRTGEPTTLRASDPPAISFTGPSGTPTQPEAFPELAELPEPGDEDPGGSSGSTLEALIARADSATGLEAGELEESPSAGEATAVSLTKPEMSGAGDAGGMEATAPETSPPLPARETVATTPPTPPTPSPIPSSPSTPEPAPTPAATAFKSSPVFATKVQPLLSKYCYECHGISKQKGDLRLDSPTWIRNGGKSGPVIVPGNPSRSSLHSLIVLPKDDPDVMPAKGETMKVSETRIIELWIKAGADLGDDQPFQPARGSGGDHVAASGFRVDELSQTVPDPDPTAMEKLREQFVLIRPASANGALLEVDFSHVRTSGGKFDLAADLAPLAQNVYTLDLSRAEITDGDLAVLPGLVNLAKLHLNQTPVTDAGLANVKSLTRLETLNLYGTKVTDAVMDHLLPLENLRKLYLFQTDVTPSGVIPLRSANPDLIINMGQ